MRKSTTSTAQPTTRVREDARPPSGRTATRTGESTKQTTTRSSTYTSLRAIERTATCRGTLHNELRKPGVADQTTSDDDHGPQHHGDDAGNACRTRRRHL